MMNSLFSVLEANQGITKIFLKGLNSILRGVVNMTPLTPPAHTHTHTHTHTSLLKNCGNFLVCQMK